MGSASDAIANLRTGLQLLATTVAEKIKDEVEKEMVVAKKEFGLYQGMAFQNKFNEFVSEFYSSYPTTYKRREGLYDVLELKTDEYGMVIYEQKPPYDNLYVSSQAYPDRKGEERESLYKTVFVEGFHGGAKYDFVKNKHPKPGVPYYRAGPKFCRWGHKASKAGTSIYVKMNDWVKKEEVGEILEGFKTIMTRHAQDAADRVKKQIPDIKKSIMG